jgi:hypothetical protein
MEVTTGKSTENRTQTLGSLTFPDKRYNSPHITVSVGNDLFKLDMIDTC